MRPRALIETARLAPVFACAIALALSASAAASAAGASAESPLQERTEPPELDPLLDRFPIGTETVNTEPVNTEPANTTSERVSPPAVTVPLEVSRGDSSRTWIVAAALGAALLAVATAGSLLIRSARRRAAEPPWTIPDLRLLQETLALSNETWNKLQRADPSIRRSPPVTEVAQDKQQQQPAEAHDGEAAQPSEHTGVVERVSAILHAAEAAAAAIREEATVGAAEIRRQAEKEGQAHIAQIKEEAARIRNDAVEAAKEARSGAEAYGANQRREAEQRVQQELARAEAQARATRQAAEEMARQIEEAAREREEALRAQMRPLETSLKRALDAFRGISAQLEELLGDDAAREGETLVDALSGPVKRAGDWEETAPPPARSNG
jgi:hypothetical protein